uniref:Uncharacterized protein n=1 Tax=Triticum urartu TaxID=4572 RepID=A0A8R7TS13_TRIUA
MPTGHSESPRTGGARARARWLTAANSHGRPRRGGLPDPRRLPCVARLLLPALAVASLWSARCGSSHGAALTGLPRRRATAAAPSQRGGGAQRHCCEAGYLKRPL